MGRLDAASADSQDRVVGEVQAVEKDLRELKTRQRIGPNNIVIRYNVGPVITRTFVADTPYTFIVTFTPEHPSVFSQLEVDINIVSSSSLWHVYVWPDPNSQLVVDYKRWIVWFMHNTVSGTLNIGLFVRSFDTGSIAWVET